MAEFAEFARTQPKTVTWAMPGVGTTGHLAAEMINRGLKLDVPMIAYRGGAPSMKDVLGGHVTAYVAPLTSAGPLIRSGMVKPLAVTGSKRVRSFPELPTVAESGIPGFEISSWYGLWGPAGLPKDIVDKLNAAVNKAVQSPGATARFAEMSFETADNTPAEFAALIDDEIRRVGQIIRAAKIRIDP
jgi:tripartite-type tricarboxylate transporter receptor subunit TctC